MGYFLKNKFIPFCFLFLLYSCAGEDRKQQIVYIKQDEFKTSEGAVLMRACEAALKKSDTESLSRLDKENIIESLHRFTRSELSDPDVRDSNFIKSIEQVNYFIEKSDLPDSSFRATLITLCVNCHKLYCPGPVKRIEKLRR